MKPCQFGSFSNGREGAEMCKGCAKNWQVGDFSQGCRKRDDLVDTL